MPWFSAHVKSWEKVSLCFFFAFCAKLFFHKFSCNKFLRFRKNYAQRRFPGDFVNKTEFHFVSKTKQFDLWFSCGFSLLSNFLGHWFCITRSLAQISTSSQFSHSLRSAATSTSPSLESLGFGSDLLCSLSLLGATLSTPRAGTCRENFEGDFLGRNLFPCDVSIQQLFTQCSNSLIE